MKRKHILSALLIGVMLATSSVSVYADTYTIQTGDTLSDISAKTGMSVQEIMEANGITDAGKIYAGKSLTLTNAPSSTSRHTVTSLYGLFDAKYYAAQNPDVVAVYGTSKSALYKHFKKYGMKEGRSISADFDVNAYRSAYPDLQEAFGNDISKYYQHYLTFGQKENRTLLTTDACVASGITVYDFNGNTISAPATANADNSSSSAPASVSDSSDSASAENEYWKTGTWYCVETSINADGVMQSQGHFPHELYQLIDNGDGTFSYYAAFSHGAWVDGTFHENPFQLPSYSEKMQEVRDAFDHYLNPLEYCTNGFNITNVPVGVYDEGCIHLCTIVPNTIQRHNWTYDEQNFVYRCSDCSAMHYFSYNYEHIDTDNDGRCDICDIYFAPHTGIDEDNDWLCDICGASVHNHVDSDNNGYCDECWLNMDFANTHQRN